MFNSSLLKYLDFDSLFIIIQKSVSKLYYIYIKFRIYRSTSYLELSL